MDPNPPVVYWPSDQVIRRENFPEIQFTRTENEIMRVLVMHYPHVAQDAHIRREVWPLEQDEPKDVANDLHIHLMHIKDKLAPLEVKIERIRSLGWRLLTPVMVDWI